MTVDYGFSLDKAITRISELLKRNPYLKVLDVGGAMKPLVYATYVLDHLPYERRSQHNTIPENWNGDVRYTKDSWIERDICKTPWPFRDKTFDIVWCTQTVEDVRDPISVIQEISRVGRQGFLSTVHRSFESMLGDDDYAGYIHHRWLVEPVQYTDELKFLFKYPLLHIRSNEFRPNMAESQFIECWWTDEIRAYEQQLTSLLAIEQEFRDYAERHK